MLREVLAVTIVRMAVGVMIGRLWDWVAIGRLVGRVVILRLVEAVWMLLRFETASAIRLNVGWDRILLRWISLIVLLRIVRRRGVDSRFWGK